MSLSDRRDALRHVRGPRDACLLVCLMGLAASVPLLMRLPLRTLAWLIEPRWVPTRVDPERVDHVVELAHAALQLGRPLVRPGCLTRGLTLYYALRRSGVDVVLEFGISTSATTASGIEGHCWLLREGQPYLEPSDSWGRYVPMYALGRA